jgi:hypothetical protein
MSQTLKQCLRLGSLRHLRRRRKTFQRGREDVAGVNWTGGRLPELRQSERRLQFEAPRLLGLREGSGGTKRFLRRGIGRVQLEQDFAADAMQEAVRPILPRFSRKRQRASMRLNALSPISASISASRAWWSGTCILLPWSARPARLSRSSCIPASRPPSWAVAQPRYVLPHAKYNRPSARRFY